MNIENLNKVATLNAELEEVRSTMASISQNGFAVVSSGEEIDLSKGRSEAISDLIVAELMCREANLSDQLSALGVEVNEPGAESPEDTFAALFGGAPIGRGVPLSPQQFASLLLGPDFSNLLKRS